MTMHGRAGPQVIETSLTGGGLSALMKGSMMAVHVGGDLTATMHASPPTAKCVPRGVGSSMLQYLY